MDSALTDTPPQEPATRADDRREPGVAVTEETIKAVAERVYALLLRDLRQERERNHSAAPNSRTFKRG